MVARFETYVRNVAAHWTEAQDDRTAPEDGRIRDSVMAFVRTDYAKACYFHFVRTGDWDALEKSTEALELASEQKHGSRFVLTPFYEHLLNQDWVNPVAAEDYGGEHILNVDRLDPNWVDGNLELVSFFALKRADLLQRWIKNYRISAEAEADAAAKRSYAERLRGGAVASGAGFVTGAKTTTPSSADGSDRAREVQAKIEQAEAAERAGTQSAEQANAIEKELTANVLTWFGLTKKQLANRMAAWMAAVHEAAEQSAKAAILRLEAGALGDSNDRAPAASDPGQRGRELETEAAAAEIDMGRHGAIADDTQKNLLEFVDRVPKRLRNLLPHMVLQKDGQLSPASFAGTNGEGLRWERMFTRLHVRALDAWSKTQSKDVELQTLSHIRKHFQAQHHDLVFRCLALQMESEASRKLYAEGIERDRATWRRILEVWFEGEPEFWRLSWVLPGPNEPDPIFDTTRISEMLVDVSRRRNVTPALLLNIGWWLEPLNEKEALRLYSSVRERLREDGKRGDLMLQLAERLRDLNKIDDAIRCYRLATDMPFRHAETERYGEAHIQIAQLEWNRGSDTGTVSELERLSLSAAKPGWRSTIARYVEANPRSSAKLRAWLDNQQKRCHSDPEAMSDAVDAMTTLVRAEHSMYLQSNPSADEMIPIKTPLILEAHPAFFPQDANTPQVARMLAPSGLNTMRESVGARYGLDMPGTRIRPNPALHESTYRILVCEVPRAYGLIDPTSDYGPVLIAAVGDCMRRNIDAFVGVQETRDLLEQWRRQDRAREGDFDLIVSVPRYEVLLTDVLRALVREGICLQPLDDVITAFIASRDSPLERLIGNVRASLPTAQLGFKPGAPQELERELSRFVSADGGIARAIRQSQENRLRERVVKSIDADCGIVVVRDPAIRSAVRSLVRSELPELAVLTQEEIAGRQLDMGGMGSEDI